MANRVDPSQTSEGAAAATAAAAPAASGGFKTFLPLILTIVIMPVVAYAMTSFVLLPSLQKGLGIKPSAEQTEGESGEHGGDQKNAKRYNATMNKLLVNVAGTMGARYLLVSLTLVSTDAKFKSKLDEYDAQLRDMACGALATKTLADLEKPGARNLIRTELISGFNNILGGAVVQEIFLTEFAIQ